MQVQFSASLVRLNMETEYSKRRRIRESQGEDVKVTKSFPLSHEGLMDYFIIPRLDQMSESDAGTRVAVQKWFEAVNYIHNLNEERNFYDLLQSDCFALFSHSRKDFKTQIILMLCINEYYSKISKSPILSVDV